MVTIECLIQRKYPISHILTEQDKRDLLKENKNINYSYLSLLQEVLSYRDTSVDTLLRGWGGVRLVKINK